MRSLPDPGFAGDDGTTPPRLAEALATHATDPDGEHHATLAVLQYCRLLVPVVAVLGEVEHDEQGLAHDKSSGMAAVLMKGRDGRLALLSFTGTDAMNRWDPAARPVPVTARQAAEAALQDGAAALLVDVAGPTVLVVEGEDLQSLAQGFRLLRTGDRWGWVRHGPAEEGRPISDPGGGPAR